MLQGVEAEGDDGEGHHGGMVMPPVGHVSIPFDAHLYGIRYEVVDKDGNEVAYDALDYKNHAEALKAKDALEKKHGKPKSLSILAHRLGRAVYYMLLRDQPFDMRKFLATRSGGNDPAKWLTGANALPVAGQAIGSL